MNAASTAPAPSDALPPGTRLLWYEIRGILGRGGFAITYLATDSNLQQAVALKEYLPLGLGERTADGVRAKPGQEANFAWGRERFLAEARMLARFKHRNIVRVVSFFEANDTAYLVMDFEEGQSLSRFLADHPQPEAATLRAILDPLLAGLDELHRSGCIHRDIKPDNIYLRADGSPVLLDFGAARQALGSQTQNLTALLSPGYAPPEQYFSGKDRQGPWSDIYALAAVMYRAITGRKPPEASLRSNALINGLADPMLPAERAGLGIYPRAFLRAVDCGLRLREGDRPRSLAEWRAMMDEPEAEPETVVPLDLSALDFGSAPTAAPTRAPSAATPPAPATMPATATAAPTTPGKVAPAASAADPTLKLSPPAPPPRAASPRPPPTDPEAPRRPAPARWRWPLAILLLVVVAATLRSLVPSAPVRATPPAARPPTAASEPVPEGGSPGEFPRRDAAKAQPAATMQGCKEEAERHCRGVTPGDGRFVACIRANLQHMSAACRPLLLERLRERPPRN